MKQKTRTLQCSAPTKINRKQSGLTTILLVFALAFFVLLPIAAFGFELARMHLAYEELKVATDAAALAAGTTRANLAMTDPGNQERQAIAIGLYLFKKNAVFGRVLDRTTYGAYPGSGMEPGRAYLQFFFERQRVRAQSWLCVAPAFGLSLLPPQVISVNSAASGMPKLDIVIALDTSHSMTQETPVFVVKRFMDGGKLQHKIQMHAKLGSKRMNEKYATGWPYFPMDLGARGDVLFDADLRVQHKHLPEEGQPPGKDKGTADAFTDMVIDIPTSGSSYFAGIMDESAKAAVLVEAFRGNLENSAVFESSGAKTALAGIVEPRAGFQNEYLKIAQAHLPLFSDAVKEVVKFIDAVHESSDAHFGLTTFSGIASRKDFDHFRWFKVSPRVPGAGQIDVKLPYVDLSHNGDQYDAVHDALVDENGVPQFVPEQGTDTGGSVQAALEMLHDRSKSRDDAKRIVVLVTDGMPRRTDGDYFHNYPLALHPSSTDAATHAAYEAAKDARREGIPIFAVAFLHIWDRSEAREGRHVLNEMVRLAKHGSQYYESRDIPGLREDLGSVARQLVRLVN